MGQLSERLEITSATEIEADPLASRSTERDDSQERLGGWTSRMVKEVVHVSEFPLSSVTVKTTSRAEEVSSQSKGTELGVVVREESQLSELEVVKRLPASVIEAGSVLGRSTV